MLQRQWHSLSLDDGRLRGASSRKLQRRGDRRRRIQRIRPRASRSGPQNLEIVFREDMKVYDGRFANNGWLQELPDVFTKITWDNAVLMGPATAEAARSVTDHGQVDRGYERRRAATDHRAGVRDAGAGGRAR